MNILSNKPIQSINPSISSCYDQTTTNLFDRQSRCTCHYFNLNENYLTKNIHKNLISNNSTSCLSSSSSSQPLLNIISSLEHSSDIKYILNINDFSFWYDVRSTLLDVIDRVVAINENHHLTIQQTPSTIIKYCLPKLNPIYRRIKRTKTSIASQTSCDYQQQRNAKVQTNTITLFPLQKQNFSSSKLFFN